MVDTPIVSSEVDDPDTMPVTMVSVEMATGPPAPPAPPEPPVLCTILVSFSFVQSSRRLTDPVAVAVEPVPAPVSVPVPVPFPVVDVTVTVPVADVTVTLVVVLAPEAPVTVARAAAHRLTKALIHVMNAEVRDMKIDIRTSTI